jgi:hypothetical protein
MQPLPVLPLALPNLALYIQAALDESRRASGADSRSRLKDLVRASDNNRAVGQVDRPDLLNEKGVGGARGSSSSGGGNVGPPVNSPQAEIGGPSELSKRRDDAGRYGFFSKLLGKNKPQRGVKDEVFEGSSSLLPRSCEIADDLSLNSCAIPR